MLVIKDNVLLDTEAAPSHTHTLIHTDAETGPTFANAVAQDVRVERTQFCTCQIMPTINILFPFLHSPSSYA